MRVKLIICVLLGLTMSALGQATGSIAPDTASKEDVRKLFDVMASQEQMRQMMQQVFKQMQAIKREELKKAQPDISDEELARADRRSEDLLKSFPWDDVLDDMVPIYQRHFTKSDIAALTAFYSSSAGQKLLREMPAVVAESMRAAYPRILTIVDGTQKQSDEKNATQQK